MALPQTLGRLTLLQSLGGDTYTASWLYHDPDRGVPVVVRALADAFVQHPQARADFIGGTGPFQAISSPQYVAVRASGQAPDGTPYVVTPYTAAETLEGPTTPPTGSPFAGPDAAAPPTAPVTPSAPALTEPLPTFGPPQTAPYADPASTSSWPGFVPPPDGPMGWSQPPARRRWPLIVGLLTALVVLAAVGVTAAVTLGGSDNSSSPSPTNPSAAGTQPGAGQPSASPSTGTPASGTPSVGQCRALTDAVVPKASDSTPAIDCSQKHTAQTYYVGRFNGSKEDNTYAGEVCSEHLAAGLGLSQKQVVLTAYQVLFFAPTSAQWSAGQRWFRCDVALLAGTHVLPLPTDLTPNPLPDSLAACLDQKGETTPCDQTHVLRASGTYTLTGPTLPSRAKAQAQGRAQCPQGSAYFTWPNEAAEYKAGLRTGVCWSVDSPGAGGGTNT